MKKLYKVTALLVGGEASDDIDVCVCESKELAQKIVEKLTAQNAEDRKRFDDYGYRCCVRRGNWDSTEDEDALEALKEAKEFDCPYKRDIKLEKCTCGYEITCKGHSNSCDYQSEYTFWISEIDLCDKIEDVRFDY